MGWQHVGVQWARAVRAFFRRHWIGTIIMLAVTIVFFWPIIIRIDSYSPGGDAMFNAWILERNQFCILQQHCPNYLDANIYYPNKDTMLYSEEQFTPGLLMMPFHWVDANPLFQYNLYTILCFFFAAWFMYLLVKRLSKGNEFVSVLAGLVFAYAPMRMAAVYHMQNISIFFLPIAALTLLKFFERKNKWYLLPLFGLLTLQFYASWYQMVFVLAVFAIVLLGMGVFKLERWKWVAVAGVTVLLAAATTAPLARQYVKFSHDTGASFPLTDQLLYESSLSDYWTPHPGTLIGKLYHHVRPGAHIGAYNLDSFSYHGVIMYAIAGCVIVMAFRRRKQSAEENSNYKWIIIFSAIGVAGFILSLGPLLKVHSHYQYFELAGTNLHVTVPLPYLMIDKYLPQLQFIRAVGRWSVLLLFALCCLLAYLPAYLKHIQWAVHRRRLVYVLIAVMAFVELAPLHMVERDSHAYSYNLKIPGVYTYVKNHPQIDDLVIIDGDSGYPNEGIPIARSEWVLWAGYTNRNIFNGYSGYEPPDYLSTYIEFKDLDAGDLVKMRHLGLKYVIIDRQLSESRPELIQRARVLMPQKLYEDQRYALFKIPS